MQLIGMLDSPYVRRVAISLKRMGIPFEHRPLSVFRNFEEFQRVNPAVKAPTFVSDKGEVLMDSTLILDYLEAIIASDKRLMPADPDQRLIALRLIGLALLACEKTVQLVYETTLRPPEKQHQPWLDRVDRQLHTTYNLLEAAMESANPWFLGTQLMQPDITVAVAWRFTQHTIPQIIDGESYPALARFSEQAEELPEFVATPLE
ncbi:glutathione S-transferase [Oscillatoria sp. FACHB-1407]|uniref:glutathione S-transferase n=1 Tax=Oscillatoria sp. FACHB-1407 TaxID=2692847 RepID=UPI001685FB38|nr:glutathione S-transferase [Oscillatoria sp. FACHB-1407]MBD2461095.1 glutathione S-transferase [Oscillatoria sp. FACHB-1407]